MITLFFSSFLGVCMCRYMSQQEQGLASTLNPSSSPLRGQEEQLYSFKQRGIWAWAFHPGLLGKISSSPTGLICDEPFHWAVSCASPSPLWKSSAAPHQWLRHRAASKRIIHPLQFQPHSVLLGAIAFSWKQGWWFTSRPGWSCRATGAVQEQPRHIWWLCTTTVLLPPECSPCQCLC